ncbi:MAG: hypothetical protein EPN97_06865 [Alphaproteobacteria bacterium]|nr:MAG: hypothetical protein EPN97_06865 [Alphaproteobacteria bacterium]
MASLPTVDEIEAAILEIIQRIHVRPGETLGQPFAVEWMKKKQFRPEDLKPGIDSLVAKNILAPLRGDYTLTESDAVKELGLIPTGDEILIQVQKIIRSLGLRPNEQLGQPFVAAWMKNRRFRPEDLKAVVAHLVKQGHLTAVGGDYALTEAGFKAL